MMDWISVEEKLPTVTEPVLIFWDHVYSIMVGKLIDSSGLWSVGNVLTRNVTHWMPLPEKPREHILTSISELDEFANKLALEVAKKAREEFEIELREPPCREPPKVIINFLGDVMEFTPDELREYIRDGVEEALRKF
jgi:hypothetical protein